MNRAEDAKLWRATSETYRRYQQNRARKQYEWGTESWAKARLAQSKAHHRRRGGFPISLSVDELIEWAKKHPKKCELFSDQCAGRLCLDHDHSVERNNLRGVLCTRHNSLVEASSEFDMIQNYVKWSRL